MKKIKIINSQHYPSFQKMVNKALKKGWMLQGNMVAVGTSDLYQTMYKNIK